MDDDLGPFESVATGMAVSVMPRGENPRAHGEGILEASRGFSVSVLTGDRSWQPGDEVVLACGAMGRRMAALARFRAYGDGRASFFRESPWRPFNRRLLDRYPVSLSATLGDGAPATVTDLSAGGAAVLVGETPESVHTSLTIGAGAEQVALAVSVVGGHAEESGTVLHLRFDDVTPEAALFLGSLLARLVRGLAAEAA